jgi:hypothetical protein
MLINTYSLKFLFSVALLLMSSSVNFITLLSLFIFRIYINPYSISAHQVYEERLLHTDPQMESLSSDPLEFHRDWGQRFLQKVRQRVLKQCRLAQQHRRLQDIVMEDQVPDIG